MQYFSNKKIYYKANEAKVMCEKLKNKTIYNDFLDKVMLTEEQIKILNLLLKKESIVKISVELGMSQRTVSYEIKKIKQYYEEYKKIELAKLMALLN